jgi:molecular chaperone GrpE
MTANNNRANDEHEGQDPNAQDGQSGPGAGDGGQDPDQARSEANAKAAAQEAARLAEEAARNANAQGEGDPEAQAPEDPQAALQAEIDDLKGRLQRAMAETENVRQRADRERQQAMKYAAAPLAKDLLGVADNLRRALESVPQEKAEQDETLQNLLSGVQMTEKELADAFAKHDIRKLSPAPGEKFDPHYHEAMYEVPTDEHKPGSVVHVVQEGYILNDRLLRPARVGVAKAAGGGQNGGANGQGGNVDTEA